MTWQRVVIGVAALLAVAAAALGALVILEPWWESYVYLAPIDVCLDHGGRWNDAEQRCEGARTYPESN